MLPICSAGSLLTPVWTPVWVFSWAALLLLLICKMWWSSPSMTSTMFICWMLVNKITELTGLNLTLFVCFLFAPAAWWRSRATWRCPSLRASPGFSQPTPTFLCSALDLSTSQGSITSCQIKSCSTGQLCPLHFESQLCFWLYTMISQTCPMCLYSDPSQSDPDTRDFWFNMQALQLYLQREAELNPQASYYNVGLLKYQVRISNVSSTYVVDLKTLFFWHPNQSHSLFQASWIVLI